jgi:hypothetical protein
MFRLIACFILLSACSMGVVKTGGERTYVYDVSNEYGLEDLKELSPHMITTMSRDPYKGKLEDLFSKKQKPIKRVGILVFETTLQPTRGGLSTEDKIFMSEQGKQLLTERLLAIWEQSFPILGEGVDYVKVSKIKTSKAFKADGFKVEDYIQSKRSALAPDDIFFLPLGKKTAIPTTLNPRGMRDFSLALVPATELMSGPKFSEHAKHTLNDVAKELNLDAMIIVMSRINWTASRIDKHSGEIIPEQVVIRLEASTLVPLSEYHERMKKLGESRDLPNTTVAYRAYESTLKIPVLISVPEELHTFEFIETELLNPALKTYNDLSQMLQLRIIEDLKKTHE